MKDLLALLSWQRQHKRIVTQMHIVYAGGKATVTMRRGNRVYAETDYRAGILLGTSL